MGNSADVSVVVRTNSVEGSSLGEGEEQTETSKEQNLATKVVFSQTWLGLNFNAISSKGRTSNSMI